MWLYIIHDLKIIHRGLWFRRWRLGEDDKYLHLRNLTQLLYCVHDEICHQEREFDQGEILREWMINKLLHLEISKSDLPNDNLFEIKRERFTLEWGFDFSLFSFAKKGSFGDGLEMKSAVPEEQEDTVSDSESDFDPRCDSGFESGYESESESDSGSDSESGLESCSEYESEYISEAGTGRGIKQVKRALLKKPIWGFEIGFCSLWRYEPDK
jgi:hypothetical protein